ncbi:hypothetical protein Q7P35_010702 [Cladosporium inversicolor]
MGLSFRKRLSKHTPEPSEEKESNIASKPSKFRAAVDHLREPKSATEETMSLTHPPPPPPTELPRKPEKLLCSPSKSLLNRYKGRRNSADASAPSKKVAKTSPAHTNRVSRSRSRVPSFTEHFDQSKSASELATPPRIASSTSTNFLIHTVGGVEFEMLNALQPTPGQATRSKSAEPARGRTTDNNTEEGETPHYHRKRETRSETRKSRADSTIGDLDADITEPKQDTTEPVSSDAEKPRVQATLKKKEKSNPLTPTATKLRIPRMTRSAAVTAAADSANPIKTTATDNEKSIKLVGKSDDSSDSSDSNCEFILDNNNNPGTAPNHPQVKPEQRIPPTRVIPPVHVPNRLPGLQWCSPLSGTSRPAYPWAWCKRWTCCRCGATTIVEQTVCARLTCGHHCCGGACMLEKERRHPSM